MAAFQQSQKLNIILVVALFALAGIYIVMSSNAAGPFIAAESEQGTIKAPAVTVSDTAASGSSAVKFNTPTPAPGGATSTTPCVGSAAPAQWKHVVVLMFENTYSNEITASAAPYIYSIRSKCAYHANWKDADSKVTGSLDGSYPSKPQYATITSGQPGSVSGITSNTYTTTSSVDNIFNRMRLANRSTKVYQAGTASNCQSSNFSGAYHDPLRYYTNLGGQSSSDTTYCNTHDVAIGDFMTDVNANTLPEFSMIIPTNGQNMHDNSVPSGDSWAKTFLQPFLDSARYKSGDTALLFLWDEYTPTPNLLIAPSVKPGTVIPTPAGNPIGHYSATRTIQEMLGITPLLGVSGQAPSLLRYYNGQ
jgi:hypothetical protein